MNQSIQPQMMQPSFRPNGNSMMISAPTQKYNPTTNIGREPGQIYQQIPQQQQPSIPITTQPMPPANLPVMNTSVDGSIDMSVKATLSSAIKGVMECDAKMKHLNVAMAQLRQERATHGEVLLKFMDSKKIQELQTQSGTKIACCSTQPFKPLNKKDITDIISNYPGLSPAQSKDIANFLIEHRVRAKPSRKIVQKTPIVKEKEREKDGKDSDSLLSLV